MPTIECFFTPNTRLLARTLGQSTVLPVEQGVMDETPVTALNSRYRWTPTLELPQSLATTTDIEIWIMANDNLPAIDDRPSERLAGTGSFARPLPEDDLLKVETLRKLGDFDPGDLETRQATEWMERYELRNGRVHVYAGGRHPDYGSAFSSQYVSTV